MTSRVSFNIRGINGIKCDPIKVDNRYLNSNKTIIC